MTTGTRVVRAVLLDVDGTLLDSNDAHAQSWVATLEQFGMTRPLGEVRRLIGMGGDHLLPALGVPTETPLARALTHDRSKLFRDEYLPHLSPLEGARALVEHLLSEGLTLVVATSASKEEIGPLLERAHVSDLLALRTSADDVDESKPEPDIVHAAVARSGHEAKDAVLLGDTPYDVQAATRAGVRVIALRSGGWRDEELVGADAIYDDPGDLLRHFEDSPLGARTYRPEQ